MHFYYPIERKVQVWQDKRVKLSEKNVQAKCRFCRSYLPNKEITAHENVCPENKYKQFNTDAKDPDRPRLSLISGSLTDSIGKSNF